jgi:hypothetical protein
VSFQDYDETTSKLVIDLLSYISLLFVALLVLYMASGSPDMSSDVGFDFRNGKLFLETGILESGPIIPQLFYAFLFSIYGLDIGVIYIVEACLFIIMIAETMILYSRMTGGRNLLTPLIPILYLVPYQLFIFGAYSAKTYSLMMVFLLAALLFLHEFKAGGKRSNLILASLFFALAYQTHIISTAFLAVPLVWFFFSRLRFTDELAFRNVVFFYCFLLFFLLPYLLWRISIDGLLFYHYPNSWGTLKYGAITNEEFWNFPTRYTFEYYRQALMISISTLTPICIILSLLWVARKREIVLSSSLLLFIVPFIASRVPTSYNYFFPIYPIVCLGSVAFLQLMLKKENSKDLQIAIVAMLLGISGVSTVNAISVYQTAESRRASNAMDFVNISNGISTNGSVLFRSYAIQPFVTNNNVMHLKHDFSEADAITFLNWTSENSVAEVMRYYSIEYIVLYRVVGWERDYNYWFFHVTGNYPIHYIRINNSTNFRTITYSNSFVLYEFLG